MKKISKFAVILSALTCAAFLTACGNSDSNNQQLSAVSQIPSQTESGETSDFLPITSQTNVSEEISDPSQVSSVEQLFSIQKSKESLEQLAENMSDDTQTTRVFAEDDKTIVIEVAFIESVGDYQEEITELLAESLENNKDIFIQAVADLEQLPNLNNIIMSVRFSNVDSTILYQKDFTSDMQDDETSTEISTDISTNKVYSSLQEYLDSPIVSSTFNQMIEQFTTDSMTMSVFVEDETKLVYQYQMMIDATDEVAEQLEGSLDNYESIILTDIKGIKSQVDNDDISIILRYIDKNYYTIYEKEYTS